MNLLLLSSSLSSRIVNNFLFRTSHVSGSVLLSINMNEEKYELIGFTSIFIASDFSLYSTFRSPPLLSSTSVRLYAGSAFFQSIVFHCPFPLLWLIHPYLSPFSFQLFLFLGNSCFCPSLSPSIPNSFIRTRSVPNSVRLLLGLSCYSCYSCVRSSLFKVVYISVLSPPSPGPVGRETSVVVGPSQLT